MSDPVKSSRRYDGSGRRGRAPATRRYDGSGRREQARETRRQILEAAKELFLDRGYAATTMADVAASAGVAVQTVYSAVGGKAALLKEVFDVSLVGDDEPVAVAERPEIAKVIAETDGRRKLELLAKYVSGVLERLSPLAVILVVAADSDEEAAKVLEGYQQGRYQGMTEFATNLKQDRLLRRGMTVERAAAVMAAHIDVTNWNTLVVRHGFTRKEFERWLVDVSEAALLRKQP
jgi:TetR/AcrR family transcriptional regulator of autoinduction and epiphytic fitness